MSFEPSPFPAFFNPLPPHIHHKPPITTARAQRARAIRMCNFFTDCSLNVRLSDLSGTRTDFPWERGCSTRSAPQSHLPNCGPGFSGYTNPHTGQYLMIDPPVGTQTIRPPPGRPGGRGRRRAGGARISWPIQDYVHIINPAEVLFPDGRPFHPRSRRRCGGRPKAASRLHNLPVEFYILDRRS